MIISRVLGTINIRGEKLRLDRFLANQGCGSRSEVKRLIRTGKVMVNNLLAREEGLQIQPGLDRVVCLGAEITYQEFTYLILNKPAGVISATEDSRQPTVIDLLDRKYRQRGLFPVGRLDKDTEGLLILTNNGELGHELLAPKKHVAKRYFARISGEVTDQDQQAFREGIVLADGGRTLPAELEILQNGASTEVNVVIYEGKFHQIKRMFHALGKEVLYLKRLAMGELQLDPAIEPGGYREMTEAEIAVLKRSGK